MFENWDCWANYELRSYLARVGIMGILSVVKGEEGLKKRVLCPQSL
jgi:hypothetical protein